MCAVARCSGGATSSLEMSLPWVLQGRLELAIMPQPPDALSIGEAMEAQDRSV